MNPFLKLTHGATTALPESGRFPGAGHVWSKPELDALTFALASKRPLLVRGEAGCGKSQLARAASEVLHPERASEALIPEVIHPRYEALDLLYRVDLVRRMADAHINKLDETNKRYVEEGPMWRALTAFSEDSPPPVLLIDEIDKADADVPNSLLEVLANRSFRVPLLEQDEVSGQGHAPPLIVITTNEERELPAAFLRRCAVLNLSPPQGEHDFREWLIRRGRVHQHLVIEEPAREAAAHQVWLDRQACRQAGFPSVGLAEYIDLLTALHSLTEKEEESGRARPQVEWLQQLSAYGLVKHLGMDQGRAAVDEGTGA